jgi:hypothetical protein
MKGLSLPNVQDVGPIDSIHWLGRGRICLLSKVLDLALQILVAQFCKMANSGIYSIMCKGCIYIYVDPKMEEAVFDFDRC